MSSRVSTLVIVVTVLVMSQSARSQVSYVDSSSGLQLPGMEGGRTEIEFGDVNGDGHPDLVSIGDHGSPFVNTDEHGIMVWFGDGAGGWSLFQNGDFGYGGIALGDVNNDGQMDVGYGMHHDYSGSDFGDQLLEVAVGDGTGRNWTPWDDGLATDGETWGMFGVDFADVDNDGDLDVGSIAFGCCAGVHVYLNDGDGSWTSSFGFIGGNSQMEFIFGDVNGDGLADFACSHGLGDGTVYLGDGLGGFTPADGNLPPESGIGRNGISLGDVNDDGRDDLGFVTSNGGLAVWTWVGTDTWQNLSGTLPSSGEFQATQIADMDLDGHGDLVAFADGLTVVYGGDGAGQWVELTSFGTPDVCGYSAMRAGVDADHNGYPDIAIVQEEDCILFGGTNRPRFFREATPPTSLWLHPMFPIGGETFVAGSVRFIDWTAAVPGTGQPTVNIELSQEGIAGPWTMIASDLPNNGRYQWLLDATLRSSSDNHLRFTLDDAMVVTSEPFTILGGPPLGDADGDGDVDLLDYEQFQLCFTGPDGTATGDCAATFDWEPDGDIDPMDFAAFQRAFTGAD